MSNRRSRAAAGLVAVALAALLSAFLAATPSAAAPKRLAVSNDGMAWSSNLGTPLFEDAGRLVPQDSVDAAFFVRNDSDDPARATLAVVDRGPSSAFARNLTIDYTIAGAGRSTVSVDPAKPCQSFVTGASIAPGDAQEVGVSLAFADVEGLATMDEPANLAFVVTLSQVGPKGTVDICGAQAVAEPYTVCENESSAVVALVGETDCPVVAGVEATGGGQNSIGGLGATGAPRSLTAVLPLGIGLLIAGAGLLAYRQRLTR